MEKHWMTLMGGVFVFLPVNFCHAQNTGFLIGVGKADITGPIAEREMMGYADILQTTKGLHTRLNARAFVIETPERTQRVALVVTDLAMMFSAVKKDVLSKLNGDFPGRFNDSNVMIMATHTHSGPGGFSHYDLFNIMSFGFDAMNFKVITDGIVRAIRTAYSNLTPGQILMKDGELRGASVNRSPGAYRANVDWQSFDTETDTENVLLRFDENSGNPIGSLNWFAVHAVSMSKKNRLVSSDNSGYGAVLMERTLNTSASSQREFVAGFANGNEGDSSPDIFSPGEGLDDFEKTKRIGTLRFQKAMELLSTAQTPLSSTLDTRHAWIHMPTYAVSSFYTGQRNSRLCYPAVGYSFVAGAKDGPSGVPGFYQGMKQGESFVSPPLDSIAYILALLVGGARNGEDCHFPKPVFLSSSILNSDLFPETLPIQLIRVGELAIAGVPAEFTTMSGRRLKKMLQEELLPLGVQKVVLAGLSNDYSGYVTTPEEYSQQHYEGAFTLFGPQTLNAYRQAFAGLARSMRRGGSCAIDAPPPGRKRPLLDFVPGVVFDGKKIQEEFGQAIAQPMTDYRTGESVLVQFRAGHPKNALTLLEHFTEIQRFEGGRWLTVVEDGDLDLYQKWGRDYSAGCVACSTFTVKWNIPYNITHGRYKIIHKGVRKTFFSGSLVPYQGETTEFSVH